MGGGIKCCRGCGERSVGCHSWCKRYLAEKKKHDELMEALKYDEEVEHYRAHQCVENNNKKAKHRQQYNKYKVR